MLESYSEVFSTISFILQSLENIPANFGHFHRAASICCLVQGELQVFPDKGRLETSLVVAGAWCALNDAWIWVELVETNIV